jgi:flagella basal body P-ring formation protein FlgA
MISPGRCSPRCWSLRATLIAASLLAAPVSAAPSAIQVDGPRLRLSDLGGRFVGLEGDLGSAPAPGVRRRVYRAQILALLEGSRAPALPAHLEVQTRSQRLSCKELVRRVGDALRPLLSDGLRASAIPCSRPLLLPRGELRFEVRLPQGAERRAGWLPLQVLIQAGEWPTQTVSLRAQIDGTIRVAIAAVDLPASSPLSTAEVRFEPRTAAGLPSDVITTARELSGMKTVAPLRAGAVLRRGGLGLIPLVRRGSQVTVAVEADGLRLTTRGVAREDGRRGDTISILCNASSKLIRARVVDAHRVAVDL